METVHKVGLETIFELQDTFAKKHLSESELLRALFAFQSDCLGLAYEILSSVRFEPEKQTAIRLLSSDALSHVVTGVRVALWGNFPECFELLRGALESLAQLRFVVRDGKYAVYNYERTRRFDKASYDRAIAGLGDLGSRIKSLHGKISDACNHSTATRAKFRSFKLDGEEYDRLGCAYDADAASSGLFYAMDCSLMVLYSLLEAHQQENLAFPWGERLSDLCDRFEALRAALRKNLQGAPA